MTVTEVTLASLGEVGSLAYGCWRFAGREVRDARELIETSLELGMNLIDTADVYGMEHGPEGFGRAELLLGKVLADSPVLRDNIVLATKGGVRPEIPYDSSEGYLRSACEASLRRLGVDVIDLYQIHRPDIFAHPEALAAVLHALVEEQKVRAVGVSNYSASQVEALQAYLEVPLVSNQRQFSAVCLQPLHDGTLDQCMRLGITPLAWSPLAGGAIPTGRGLRTQLSIALDQIADRQGVDRAVVALAFVLAHPSRPIAIVGTQDPGKLRQAGRVGEVTLERGDLYEIIEASEGKPLP